MRVVVALLAVLGAVSAARGQLVEDPDLKEWTPHLESFPECSLVIPLDDFQNGDNGQFSLLTYGLVTHLLHKDVPVFWAMRTGKTKGENSNGQVDDSDNWDFDASVREVNPGQTPSGAYVNHRFRASAFIIPVYYRKYAEQFALSWTFDHTKVKMYELQNAQDIDVRYELTKKPFAAVLDSSGGKETIQRNVLQAAGLIQCKDAYCPTCPARVPEPGGCTDCCHFKIMTYQEANTLDDNTCISVATEPHFHATYPAGYSFVGAMYTFVQSGGNFLAQCAGIATYENCDYAEDQRSTCKQDYPAAVPDYFYSTNGFNTDKRSLSTSGYYSYPGADRAFTQFYGPWTEIGGSVPYFGLWAGNDPNNGDPASVAHKNSYPAITFGGSSQGTFITAQAKNETMRGRIGGNVFYLGGHDYKNAGEAGRRIYMNAIMIPGQRNPNCELEVERFKNIIADTETLPGTQYPRIRCGCDKYFDASQDVYDWAPPRACCRLQDMDGCGICFGDGRSCAATTGCTPVPSQTCAAQGFGCGRVWNGCALEYCGSCQGSTVCNPTTQVCDACSQGVCSSGTTQYQCGSVFDSGCNKYVTCGSCPVGSICSNFQCKSCYDLNPTVNCSAAGKACGSHWDGCNIVNCGTCPTSTVCNLTSFSCAGCTPSGTCASAGIQCGSFFNGCQTENCGSCPSGQFCSDPLNNQIYKCANLTNTGVVGGCEGELNCACVQGVACIVGLVCDQSTGLCITNPTSGTGAGTGSTSSGVSGTGCPIGSSGCPCGAGNTCNPGFTCTELSGVGLRCVAGSGTSDSGEEIVGAASRPAVGSLGVIVMTALWLLFC